MRRSSIEAARVILMFVAVLAIAPAVVAAAEPNELGGEPAFLVVRVEVSSPDEVSLLEHFADVWAYHVEKGIVDAAVDAEGEQALRDLGFRYEIDTKLTEKYNRPLVPLPEQIGGIAGYPCYRTVEETLATGAALAAAYPDLAEWIDIGDSWEKATPGGLDGYDLMVLRLTNTTNGIPSVDKPKLWVNGAIHAREYTTAETVTRFAEYLLANYGIDPDVTWLLDNHEVHLLLQTNPDGRKHAETGELWRKNTNQNYCGVTSPNRGADLNRNFDFEWGCCGGSSPNPCDDGYRGPSPASEPETQAVQAWVGVNFPDWRPDDLTTPAPDDATGIFIDVHSYGGDVLTAFGFQDPPAPNNAQYLRLGRKLSFFNDYDARLGSLYTVDGSTKDWAYGRLGIPAFTIELGDAFFESCGTFEHSIYPDNLRALQYAARAARAPYTQSSGPEVVVPDVSPAVAAPGAAVTVTATIDDTRYGPGESSPPTSVEAIAEAELFIDVPPWQVGAVAIAMSPLDGLFNSTVEAVTGSFGTTGLADGRHIVYLRGRDAAGYWGTVRAVWVGVLDPATAGHIAGVVTDAATGLPLEATVSSGVFSTDSVPATGAFDLLVPPGDHDVSAVADGYGTVTATGVHATSGAATTQGFELAPYEILVEDDVEAGNQGWTAQGLWAITSEASSSPTHSWTDSPGGNYGDDWDYSLTSPSFDLSDRTGIVVEFSHIYNLETSYDTGLVEVTGDGGITWTYVTAFSGVQTSSWERVEVPVPELDHASAARVRFRIVTDSNTNRDGWHIDDVVIRGFDDAPSGLVFRDNFESGTAGAWSSVVP